MTPKLQIEQVSKRFGDVVALHPTDLELRAGEFLTLLGPSGSGKTTLLLMIAGLLMPSSGRISIDGRPATYTPPFQRDLGMVFQNYALFPHLTIFENIAFPLRMRRHSDAQVKKEVERVLEIVQLPEVAKRYPRQISGGQQQRIALARCIVYNPSIILMDEPLGALDKRLRDQLQIEIKRIHTRLGTTILYVTHDQHEAMAMSDRVCLMSQGRVDQIGTPEELYFRPRSTFAAEFLGESNIFAAEIAGRSGGEVQLRSPALPGASIFVPDAAAGGFAEIRVMVRPERMLLSTPDGAARRNVCAASIEAVQFGGGTTRYTVRPAGGEALIVTALTGGARLRVGEEVAVSWHPEDSVVLAVPGRPARTAAA